MARVKIWISPVHEVSDALIIEQPNGSEEHFVLNCPARGLERLGSGYWHTVLGHEGTCYDLPRGFPASDLEASQRLNDPSISNTMQALIRLNFPLRVRPRPVARPRRIA